jgi:hypothetical protein
MNIFFLFLLILIILIFINFFNLKFNLLLFFYFFLLNFVYSQNDELYNNCLYIYLIRKFINEYIIYKNISEYKEITIRNFIKILCKYRNKNVELKKFNLPYKSKIDKLSLNELIDIFNFIENYEIKFEDYKKLGIFFYICNSDILSTFAIISDPTLLRDENFNIIPVNDVYDKKFVSYIETNILYINVNYPYDLQKKYEEYLELSKEELIKILKSRNFKYKYKDFFDFLEQLKIIEMLI